MRTEKRVQNLPRPGGTLSNKTKEQIWGWIFAAPAIILGTVFIVLPFIMALVMSFTSQRLIHPPIVPTRFIGLNNFKWLFDDAEFWQALRNTALFVVVVVPVQSSFALLLALLVNQKKRLINFFRATYFVPVVLPMVVVATIWGFLYSYDVTGDQQGLINSVLQFVSGGRLGPYWWVGDPHVAMLAIIILSIWQGAGFQMVIFLAGLQDIPAELYEAAEIDGGTKWQQFWYVTFPLLRNTTIFIVTATIILAFGLFDQVNILTRGGPLGTTTTLTYFMVTRGFDQMRVGYGSAVAVFFFVLVVGITLIQRKVFHEERTVQ